MTNEPRLAPVDPGQLDDDTARLLDALGGLNIFATLAHHPRLLRKWLVFGNHVLNGTTLAERERELVILRAGWRCASEYEFGQHTLIGQRCGLTADEVRRLATEGVDGWSPSDAVLVAATDELVADHTLSDASWEALAGLLDTPAILDLIFTVGQYVLVSTALNALGVRLDEGVPGWPT
jgi:4-carboxymuconolactone decarboxylase